MFFLFVFVLCTIVFWWFPLFTLYILFFVDAVYLICVRVLGYGCTAFVSNLSFLCAIAPVSNFQICSLTRLSLL